MKSIRYIFLAVEIVLLCACGNLTQAGPGRLTVLEWNGFESPNYYQPFSDQHPDTKVEFSFMADDAESFAKAQNGSNIDVMHPCANYFWLFVEKGLVQPIDTSRIKNWKSIYQQLTGIGQINGKQYFIPWDWGYDAILARTDKVENVPQSWADLWKEEYAGHIAMIDTGEEAYLTAALSLGIDPYSATPQQEQQIKQKLIALNTHHVKYWSDPTDVSNQVTNGDLWVVGGAWNESYVNLLKANIPVQYIMPKEKAIGYVCGYGISSKTRSLDLAYDFINAHLDARSAANMVNEQGYGTSNQDAIALVKPETVKALGLDQPDLLERVFFMKPLSEAQHRHYIDLWSEIKAAP